MGASVHDDAEWTGLFVLLYNYSRCNVQYTPADDSFPNCQTVYFSENVWLRVKGQAG